MEPHLRLLPGQQHLTLAQKAEAEHFALERINAHVSTAPVDEQEAEAWLQQAYRLVYGVPLQEIRWVDGPLEFVQLLLDEPYLWDSVLASVSHGRLERPGREWMSINVLELPLASVKARVAGPVLERVAELVADSVEQGVWQRVGQSVLTSLWPSLPTLQDRSTARLFWEASVEAYRAAPTLAFYRFFDEYLAPNEVDPLIRFNEGVAGYWLAKQWAILLRRPKRLQRDTAGWLHSAIGKCVEYPDGWGFYAWHGVQVPGKVILTPEQLTRQDFLETPNLESRRVIQERMGSRFVSELGGQVIDEGPRGRLYEVPLPEDPEEVARYVQVQDASSSREYFLRVPPTVQTAAEAVARSFQVAVEEYAPAHET